MTNPVQPRDVHVISEAFIYDGHMKLKVVTLEHRRYDGTLMGPIQREVLVRRPAVAVLLHDPARDEIVLVEQFRIGAIGTDCPWVIELVAGLCEPGEETMDVARRETQEETGLEVDSLTEIGCVFNSVGGTNEQTTVYYGQVHADRALRFGGVDGEHEDIRVIALPVPAFVEKLRAGELRTATLSMAGWWFVANRLK